MKVFLSGGGTAGHVNPALAIGAELEKRYEGCDISYVGTPNGIENRLVTKYPMFHIRIQGVARKLTLSNLKTAYYALTSFSKARKLIKKEKPDLVVGTGGYACFPIVSAAASLNVPVVLHESNTVPGMVVRRMQKKVDAVFINFEKTKEYLDGSSNIVHVGTPLRPEFMTVDREAARRELGIGADKTMILSFGGSLGATRLNDEILTLMKECISKRDDVVHVHGVGKREYESFMERARDAGLDKCPNIIIKEYINDMPSVMAASDLIISRSGALTLSEIAYLGIPSILIPSPNVTDDQQYKNAAALGEKGGAIVIRESMLEKDVLINAVCNLIENANVRLDMSENCKKFAVVDSGEKICREIEEIFKRKQK